MISRICRCVFTLLLAFSVSLFAQETRGTINGHVLDEQGGAMPGVTVTITNVDTNVSATLTTNSTGYYQAPLLLPGKLPGDRRAAGFQDVSPQRHHPVGGPAGHGGPDAWSRSASAKPSP